MAKGGDFERTICYALTEWWCEGQNQQDVHFWRTAGSGGRATARMGRGKETLREHCGDIGAVTDFARPLTDLITFELKTGYSKKNSGYTGITLSDLVDVGATIKRPQALEAWIGQARKSAKNAKTPYWALLHHRTGRKTVMYFPAMLYDELVARGVKPITPLVRARLTIEPDGNGIPIKVQIVLTTLSGFMKCVKPDAIRSVLEDNHGYY